MVVTRRKGSWGIVNGKWGQIYMVMEEDLTLGGGHTVQYIDNIS